MTQIISCYLWMYAVLLFSGAYMGHKAGSKISLIMGLASGLLTLAGLVLYNSSPQAGRILLIVLTFFLTIIFSKRLITTKKFMPAGLLLIFSILAFVSSLNLS